MSIKFLTRVRYNSAMASKSSNDAKHLLNLFDRPTEPVFMPKGEANAVFDVPKSYLVDRYKPLQGILADRFGGDETIPIKEIPVFPDFRVPMQLSRSDQFSLFIPHHRKMAARLITIFMGMRNVEDLLSAAVFCRDRMNPYLFNYALSVAILHREDTKQLEIPSLSSVFPEKFIDGAFFSRAKEEANIVPGEQRIPFEIPKDFTATDLDVEHRLAYFREDLGVNQHHWHWHMIYPTFGPTEVVRKDRRGELFYYTHHQMLSRYNFERFCNYLGRCERLNNWREPMAEGYFSKLDSINSSRVWAPRPANSTMKDVRREDYRLQFDILDLERWRDRIFAAIHSGRIVDDNGETIELTESKGIDLLGCIVESNSLSANANLYGDLHNLGHTAIALCHDPDQRNLEQGSVMVDSATAMRDPIFYRWHAFIDDIFEEHKNTLPGYSEKQLHFPAVHVLNVEVQSEGHPPNQFHTFWQKNDLDLSRGIDFQPRGRLLARFTHLQHTPFTYNISIENKAKNMIKGTVRIFLAPRDDERGHRMRLRDQKNFFIEMDRFVTEIDPGKSVLKRRSVESSVTIPFESTFRDYDQKVEPENLERFVFCGCGWPSHLLVPKGTPDGFAGELFVMITNYEDDKVDRGKPNNSCDDASSFCGLLNDFYPDKRSMGFPFDRSTGGSDLYLKAFLTPNMAVTEVKLFYNNQVLMCPKQDAQDLL